MNEHPVGPLQLTYVGLCLWKSIYSDAENLEIFSEELVGQSVSEVYLDVSITRLQDDA